MKNQFSITKYKMLDKNFLDKIKGI